MSIDKPLAEEDARVRLSNPARTRWQWVVGLAAALVWLALWTLPWADWFAALPYLRVLLAFGMWLLPGWGIARLLWQEGAVGAAHKITLAFAVSMTLTALLGLTARAVQGALPFVIGSYISIGAVTLILWAPSWRAPRASALRVDASAIVTYLPLFAALALVAALTYGSQIYADDYTYNAYLLQFQKAPTFTLQDIFFNLDQPSAARFWLMFYPLVQAFLAEVSQVHFLDLTLRYLSPLLAMGALLAVYALARTLGLAARLAVFAVVVQLAAYLLLTHAKHLGLVFFDQLNEDKALAAFFLTPVFWFTLVQFLGTPTRRGLLLLVVVGLGLALTHPTIAGAACLIAGLYALLEQAHAREWKPLAQVGGALALVMALPFAMRFVDNTYSHKLNFELVAQTLRPDQEARLWTIDGRQFYGIAPGLVTNLPFLLAAVSGILALVYVRREKCARFLTAALAIVLIAILPLTGWLIGLAVTPAHLWRVLWLTPFGLCGAFLALIVGRAAHARFGSRLTGSPMRLAALTAFASLVILGGAFGYLWLQPAADQPAALVRDPRQQERYADYVQLSAQLDKQLTAPAVFVGTTQELNRILPSLSIFAKVVAFRDDTNMRMIGNLDDAEVAARQAAWRTMTKQDTPASERLDAFAAYQVRYILATDGTAWLNDLRAANPARFQLIAQAGNLRIYALNPS